MARVRYTNFWPLDFKFGAFLRSAELKPLRFKSKLHVLPFKQFSLQIWQNKVKIEQGENIENESSLNDSNLLPCEV